MSKAALVSSRRSIIKNLTDTEYTTSGLARYGSEAQKLAHGVQAETIGTPWTVRVELRYHVGEGI